MLVALKSRSEFLRATASGRKWVTPSFIVQIAARMPPDGKIGVGFTATKKLGNAVARNRVKRRLRAAVREVIPRAGSQNHNYVLIGRTQALQAEFSSLLNDLSWALKSLHKNA